MMVSGTLLGGCVGLVAVTTPSSRLELVCAGASAASGVPVGSSARAAVTVSAASASARCGCAKAARSFMTGLSRLPVARSRVCDSPTPGHIRSAQRPHLVKLLIVEAVDAVLAGRENVDEIMIPAQGRGRVLVPRHQRLAGSLVRAADGQQQRRTRRVQGLLGLSVQWTGGVDHMQQVPAEDEDRMRLAAQEQ